MQEGGEKFFILSIQRCVGVTLFRVTKEQDTSDIDMKMSLATVPLPQEQNLDPLSSSGDWMRMNMIILFFVTCCFLAK